MVDKRANTTGQVLLWICPSWKPNAIVGDGHGLTGVHKRIADFRYESTTFTIEFRRLSGQATIRKIVHYPLYDKIHIYALKFLDSNEIFQEQDELILKECFDMLWGWQHNLPMKLQDGPKKIDI